MIETSKDFNKHVVREKIVWKWRWIKIPAYSVSFRLLGLKRSEHNESFSIITHARNWDFSVESLRVESNLWIWTNKALTQDTKRNSRFFWINWTRRVLKWEIKTEKFFNELSFTSWYCPIEFFIQEQKPVVMEKYEFEVRDKPTLKASLQFFRTIRFLMQESNWKICVTNAPANI